MQPSATDIIRQLELEPLPEEGGYFQRTYLSAQKVETERGERPCATIIYYLVTPESFSALHRVGSDEIFHFLAGDPVEMAMINPNADGEVTILTLGPRVLAGETLQVLVPANFWQGTRLRGEGKWALLSCTVVPGFDYADFELASEELILHLFPGIVQVIRRFIRE